MFWSVFRFRRETERNREGWSHTSTLSHDGKMTEGLQPIEPKLYFANERTFLHCALPPPLAWKRHRLSASLCLPSQGCTPASRSLRWPWWSPLPRIARPRAG